MTKMIRWQIDGEGSTYTGWTFQVLQWKTSEKCCEFYSHFSAKNEVKSWNFLMNFLNFRTLSVFFQKILTRFKKVTKIIMFQQTYAKLGSFWNSPSACSSELETWRWKLIFWDSVRFGKERTWCLQYHETGLIYPSTAVQHCGDGQGQLQYGGVVMWERKTRHW